MLSFSCDRCDFGVSGMPAWKACSYRIAGERIPLVRRLAWCPSCRSIKPAETIPTAESAERLRARGDRLRAALERDRADWLGGKFWLARWLCRERTPPHLSHTQSAIDHVAHELHRHRRLLEALKDRESGPRCLDCGAEGVTPLPEIPEIPEADGEHAPVTATGFAHPGCGGQVLVSHPGLRFFVPVKEHAYDREGRLLSVTSSQ